MPSRKVLLVVGILLTGSLTLQALSQDAAPVESPEADPDLRIWLEHVGGQVSTFDQEIVQLDLILDRAGRLDQVHLILRTGAEADTHVWYNMDNLVSVRYQFLKITGKGKVAVRTVVPLEVKTGTSPGPKPVDALDAEDYR